MDDKHATRPGADDSKDEEERQVSREPEAKTLKARDAAEDEHLRQEDPGEALERDRLQNYLNAGSLNS